MSTVRTATGLAVTACLALVALPGTAHERGSARHGDAAASVEFEKIVERRMREVVKGDDQMNVFDLPGIELTFRAALPEGLKMLAVATSGPVVSRDSAGTDLAAIEPGFSGEREYVDLEMAWDGPPTKFTVKLAPSARRAATFDLRLPLEITAYRKLARRTIPVGTRKTPVGDDVFGGTAATFSLRRDGNSCQVVLEPADVRELIEKIELAGGSTTAESGMTMWNSSAVTYSFDNVPDGDLTLKLEVRQGLQKLPVVAELKGEALP